MKTLLFISIACAAAAIWSVTQTEIAVAQRKGAFDHNIAKHQPKVVGHPDQVDCASCHKLPTSNWLTARKFPDVADFPVHQACFNCHSPFKSNIQTFCGVCHTNPGPRGVARFAFPVKSRQTQFTTIFPHDKHQDLIAMQPKGDGVAVAHFVTASYSPDEKKPTVNSCSVCHTSFDAKDKVAFAARAPHAGLKATGNAEPDTYSKDDKGVEITRPNSTFFKDSPDSHASCFTCHYQNVYPTRTDCAGCHAMTQSYARTDEIRRYSLKFDHQQPEAHSTGDCNNCHIRITRTSDLKKMNGADVPLMGCVRCHATQIKDELDKRAAQPTFQCSYCHTTAIGRFDVPASHKAKLE